MGFLGFLSNSVIVLGVVLNESLCKLYFKRCSFVSQLWTRNVFNHSHCNICKTLISQEIIKLWWMRFCTCNYTVLDPTNWFNDFSFVSSGKHWFPDDNHCVINDDNYDHNDDNSGNGNDVDDNSHENDVNIIVIMIAMIASKMIMKTTIIKMIMVVIIVTMMMIRHWMSQ